MTTHVIVIGGGYAGVIAANRLMRRTDVEVTLVNPHLEFVERIRLHQRAVGSHGATLPFEEVLHPRIRLVVDTVVDIAAGERRIRLGDGRHESYDYLVYAVGSRSADLDVPGAAAHCLACGSLADSDRLRDALDRAASSAPVTVIGSGTTGIEVAAELAEQGRSVTLIGSDRLGPYLHENGRRRVRAALADLGVTVIEGTRVTAVGPDAVDLDDGRHLPSAITIRTTGFGVPDLAVRSGLTTDPDGRLLTDETLTSVDDDRIVAAGDAAAPSGLPMRMSCQAAIPQGAIAAATIGRRIDGTEPRPITSGFVGQCISLGRRRGVFQAARTDDTAVGFSVGGRTAAGIKETVCRSVTASLRREARHPGAFRWFPTRSRERVLARRTAPVE